MHAYTYGWQLFLLLMERIFPQIEYSKCYQHYYSTNLNPGNLKFNIHSLTAHVKPQGSEYVIICNEPNIQLLIWCLMRAPAKPLPKG